MKKVMTMIWGLLAAVAVSGQDIKLTADGSYEVKDVVTVDSTSAHVLYDRAVIALSDWTGGSGKASAGLDIHDRDAGIVVYKGREFMWTKKTGRQVYDVFADFSLKVRCKDGKAQVTSTIHSMTAGGRTWNLRDAIDVSKKENDSEKRKAEIAERVAKVKGVADMLLAAMRERLKADEDDF